MATLSWEEIRAHRTDTDCWVVVHGNVYNVTTFLEDHPGGKEILLDEAGRDATDVFEEAAHSSEARDILPGLLVGRLKGHHDAVQTFDSVVGRATDSDEAKGSWLETAVLAPGALSCIALATWGYGRNISSLQVDSTWWTIMVVLLTILAAFGTFVSYIIYVDFGRLDKYPSRIRI